ncbi:hypothetical protein SteCoe_20011 [Stentor coeruleus]|uniref:Uncharacterized protein n=1 Tax=Stentor coeruleus TaxID=5963 RepID=A0A1R2BSU0_9CILI|nr:hypothetical protein SteCoe_20011 [Stentor coeruleus]
MVSNSETFSSLSLRSNSSLACSTFSLEKIQAFKARIENFLIQISSNKRNIYQTGCKFIENLEAKALNIIKSIEAKQIYVRNKLHIIKIQQLKKDIHLELVKATCAIEKEIKNLFKELEQSSKELAQFYIKKIYTDYEIVKSENILSENLNVSCLDLNKTLNNKITDFEKILINAKIYLLGEIFPDFIQEEFGLHLEGHSDKCTCIAISKKNDFFITGSLDRSIRLWNLKTRSQKCICYYHEGPVNSLALAKSGDLLVSGSDDKTIIVWCVSRKRILRVLKIFDSQVKRVHFSYNDRYIISLTSDMKLRWLDSNSLEVVHSITLTKFTIDFKTFSNNGSVLIGESTGKLFSCNILNETKDIAFPLQKNKTLTHFQLLKNKMMVLAVYKQGIICRYPINNSSIFKKSVKKYTILTISSAPNENFFVTGSKDHNVRLWDLNTLKCEKLFSFHKSRVVNVKITQDNKLIISSSSDYNIRIIDINEESCVGSFVYDKLVLPKIYLTHDSKYILSGCIDGTIFIYDITEKRKVESGGHTIKPNCLSFSTDKIFLATGSPDATVIVWKLKTHQIETLHNEHKSLITCITISDDNNYVISGSNDKNIIVWDITKRKLKAKLKSHCGSIKCVTISHDSTYIISGSSDKYVILWNISKEKNKKILEGHTSCVKKVMIISEYFVLSGSNTEIIAWNLQSSSIQYKIPLFNANKILAVNKSCKLFAVSSDKNFIVWDIVNNEQVKAFISKIVPKCVVLTESRLLIVAAYFKNKLVVFDLNDCRKNFSLAGHKSNINVIALTEDEIRLVSGSSDKSIIVWNLHFKAYEFAINGFNSEITSILATKDNEHLIIASADNTIKLYYLNDKKQLSEKNFNSCLNSLAITSDNRLLIGGLNNSNVILYDFEHNTEKVIVKHESSVQKVAVTNNDKYIISISSGLKLIIWNIKMNEIEIVYLSKETFMDNFFISNDNLNVYIPSNLSGVAVLKLKNTFKKSQKKNEGNEILELNEEKEVVVCVDVIESFVKMYDIKMVNLIAVHGDEALSFLSSFLYLDE